jgi:hypothetical protein
MTSSASIEALNSIDTTKLEELVFSIIESFGNGGCISDDVRAHKPGLAYSSITARYSSLLRKGLITRGPDKRKGISGRSQGVMRAK